MELIGSLGTFNRLMHRVGFSRTSGHRIEFEDIYVFTQSTCGVDQIKALDKVILRCEEQ